MRLAARGRLGILSVCLASTALMAGALPSGAAQGWEVLPPIPLPTDSGSMDSVKAFAPDDVWVGGDARRGREGSVSLKAQVRHWDGHRWTATPLENPMNSSVSDLDGVASNDMWAANGGKDAIPSRPNMQHWDGKRWTEVPIPDGMGDLHAVEAIASDDVWAVGGQGAITHWDGRAWSLAQVPPEFGAETFRDVTATAPDDVWVVGEWQDDKRIAHPLVLHWDGQKWTKVEVPPTPDGDGLGRNASTVAATDGQVWVGTENAGSGLIVPITFHIDAAGITSTPIPRYDTGPLTDMIVTGGTARLALGAGDSAAPLLEWRGDRWEPLPPPSLPAPRTVGLSGIDMVPGSGRMWAVGRDMRPTQPSINPFAAVQR